MKTRGIYLHLHRRNNSGQHWSEVYPRAVKRVCKSTISFRSNCANKNKTKKGIRASMAKSQSKNTKCLSQQKAAAAGISRGRKNHQNEAIPCYAFAYVGGGYAGGGATYVSFSGPGPSLDLTSSEGGLEIPGGPGGGG